jgi:hypothetical protein
MTSGGTCPDTSRMDCLQQQQQQQRQQGARSSREQVASKSSAQRKCSVVICKLMISESWILQHMSGTVCVVKYQHSCMIMHTASYNCQPADAGSHSMTPNQACATCLRPKYLAPSAASILHPSPQHVRHHLPHQAQLNSYTHLDT